MWNFFISGELTDAFNTLENIDKVDFACPLDIFILWQNCIVWFVLHPTSDFMIGFHLICDHKQPKDIIRLGFFCCRSKALPICDAIFFLHVCVDVVLCTVTHNRFEDHRRDHQAGPDGRRDGREGNPGEQAAPTEEG